MTDRQEQLLNELLKDVAHLQATREELLRQNEGLGEKIDSLAKEMRTLWDEKFDRATSTLSNFGERIGRVERDVDGMRTRCEANSSHRDRRIDDLAKEVKEHEVGLKKLWEIEHQRKGKIAVIAAGGGFLGTLLGGLLLALLRDILVR